MIRADWATPPDGDFARYVDQLMARAAQARLQASGTPVDGFDGASQAPGVPSVDPRARRPGTFDRSPGRPEVPARPAWTDAVARGVRRWALPAGANTDVASVGWSGWLREWARAAATTPPPSSGGASRQHDSRLNRPTRKP